MGGEPKYNAQIGLRYTEEKKEALDRIARAQDMDSAQVLLRRAVDAIVEYASLYGDKAVPLDMAITQRIAPRNELALAADEVATVQPEDLRALLRQGGEKLKGPEATPSSPQQSLPDPHGSPQAAPRKRGSK